MPQSLNASDNALYVRKAIPLGSALRLALAQAISLIDLLRPHGRLSPPCTSRRPRQRQKKRVSKRVPNVDVQQDVQ